MKREIQKIAFYHGFRSGLAGLCILASISSYAVDLKGDSKKLPEELQGVGVSEHLGSTVDLSSFSFTDSQDGKVHTLKDFSANGKPTLLNLVYFECPMLCTMVLNGVTDGMKKLDWSIGKEFNVITVSIDPNDTTGMASAKRENYLKSYFAGTVKHDEMLASSGWHFFTGKQDQIRKLATALGFEFKYDDSQKQFAHPAVTFILTPEGAISRYLYGITYEPKDMRLALLEASRGKIGSVFDRLLMFCYHYDPSSKGYSFKAMKAMQLAALAMVAFLAGYMTLFWTRHFQRQRKGKLK